MIAASGIQYQELAIGTERSGELDVPIGGRDDLGFGTCRNENPTGLAAEAVIRSVSLDDFALSGVLQPAARIGESDLRLFGPFSRQAGCRFCFRFRFGVLLGFHLR